MIMMIPERVSQFCILEETLYMKMHLLYDFVPEFWSGFSVICFVAGWCFTLRILPNNLPS